MPNGRLTRQTRPRLARGFAVLVLTLAAGAGCQRFPLRYAEVTPESTSKATTRVERAKPDPGPPAEIAPLPATPLAPATPQGEGSVLSDPPPNPTAESPGSPPSTQSTATPLIDQALKRASAVPQASIALPAPTKVEPAPIDPKPADAPVELPPANDPATKPPTATIDPKTAEPKVAIPKEFESAEEANNPEPEPPVLASKPAEMVAPRTTPESKPKPIDLEKPAKPVATRDEWREGLSRVRELALRRAGEPGDAAQAWAIRSRVLDWLAGEGPEPAGETGKVWNSVLATLSTATGPETPRRVGPRLPPGSGRRDPGIVCSAPDHRAQLLPEDRRVRALRTDRVPRGPDRTALARLLRDVGPPVRIRSFRLPLATLFTGRGSPGRGRRRGLVRSARNGRRPVSAPSPRLFRQLPTPCPSPACPRFLFAPALADGPGFQPIGLGDGAIFRQTLSVETVYPDDRIAFCLRCDRLRATIGTCNRGTTSDQGGDRSWCAS